MENEQKRKSEFEKARNKIPGYILIVTGLLLIAISFSIPGYTVFLGIIMLIIGVEWLLIKSNLLLAIAWTIFLLTVVIFNPWTTGITNKWIIHAIFSGTVYTGIIIGIIQRIGGILLLFVTVKKIINFWRSQLLKQNE
ncbi:hypothetical protein MKZ26_10610 [Sporosarcina sp. FSL K6-6792]|uniref:hypothetical protein n=1 Tax=Sporosarcina sp. FSL K6-6792 TaxID=2921559 RepID=UPI0030FA12BC